MSQKKNDVHRQNRDRERYLLLGDLKYHQLDPTYVEHAVKGGRELTYKQIIERSKIKSVSDNIKFNTIISNCKIICLIVAISLALGTLIAFYILAVFQFLGKFNDVPYDVSWVVPHTLTGIIAFFMGWAIPKLFPRNQS